MFVTKTLSFGEEDLEVDISPPKRSVKKISKQDKLFAAYYFGAGDTKGETYKSFIKAFKNNHKVTASNKLLRPEILQIGIGIIKSSQKKTRYEEVIIEMCDKYESKHSNCIIVDYDKVVLMGDHSSNPIKVMRKVIPMIKLFEHMERDKIMNTCIMKMQQLHKKYKALYNVEPRHWRSQMVAMMGEENVQNINRFLYD